ncbi:MAG: 16S rRNA (cytidine(1402)-2'-O)-methyltransferase [Acholeplasmatales bacterium]|nr:MAG: 16S rRNA (cytidine(1402)-2'-O)-methyltransferase [Acholeplasmatales bacterium]
MQIQASFDAGQATLYLVATPIGHLADLTVRAAETLQEVSVIFAEDTRQSKVLLAHYGIRTPMISMHQHNEAERVETVIEHLETGVSVALISDAGTPLISDPGARIVQAVIEAGYPVVTIPGPSAALTALPASGLSTEPYLFYGFLPAKSAARQKILRTLSTLPFTLIFYEAPHRIDAMIADLTAVLGPRHCVIARELTKRFESYLRFTLDQSLTLPALKGEIVVLVEGATDVLLDHDDAVVHVELLMADGHSEMEAIKRAAKARHLKKNEVYMAFQRAKKQREQRK